MFQQNASKFAIILGYENSFLVILSVVITNIVLTEQNVRFWHSWEWSVKWKVAAHFLHTFNSHIFANLCGRTLCAQNISTVLSLTKNTNVG